MRISDWSSDVCSSDLAGGVACVGGQQQAGRELLGLPEILFEGGCQVIGLQRHDALVALRLAPGGAAVLDGDRQHRAGAELAQVARDRRGVVLGQRSEEHTSELQSLMRNSYAVFCLKKKNKQ